MAGFSLRKYETQARVSVAAALASIVPLGALAFFILQPLDSDLFIYYGAKRGIAIYGAGLLALSLAGAGFAFGLNSAGQRRNDVPRMSWLGFFLSALIITITLMLLLFFRSRGESVV